MENAKANLIGNQNWTWNGRKSNFDVDSHESIEIPKAKWKRLELGLDLNVQSGQILSWSTDLSVEVTPLVVPQAQPPVTGSTGRRLGSQAGHTTWQDQGALV